MTQVIHPNVNHKAIEWSAQQVLHLAIAYSNPFRWQTRRELANDFIRHMAENPNVRMHVVELAYGDRPWELTDDDNVDHIRLRTTDVLWHKENLLNLAVRHFPADWKYGAYWDADFQMTRRDWALETIHQLQMFDWVQLFNFVQHLSGRTLPGQGHRPIRQLASFALTYVENGRTAPKGWEERIRQRAIAAKDPNASTLEDCYAEEYKEGKYIFPGAPGGGWAFTRAAFDHVGGFLDKCILGSADSFMAFGLIGELKGLNWNLKQYSQGYRDTILAWQERAAEGHGNINFIDQHVIHHFHGSLSKRGYGERDNYLIKNGYNPTTDVFYDYQGVLQLTPKKPRLRDDLRTSFLERYEDVPHLNF